MKNLILLLVLSSFSQVLHAKCDTGAIHIIHDRGFSLSFGGKKDDSESEYNQSVNVPISVNNEAACFRQKNAVRFKSEKETEKGMQNAVSLPNLDVEFENVPSPHKKQYIIVEKSNTKQTTKFHVLNFICSGEIPLSITAINTTAAEIEANSAQKPKVKANTSTVFATGAAARNLQEAMKTELAFLRLQETYARNATYAIFSKKYKDIAAKEVDTVGTCCDTVKTPSIFTSSSIQTLSSVERSIAAEFTTNTSEDVPNGCSKDFADTMKNYQLENHADNDTLKDFKVKKKGWFAKELVFEW